MCVALLVDWLAPHVLDADGQVGLEVVEVLGQLVAVVVVGEEALQEGQQLWGQEKQWEQQEQEEQDEQERRC